MEGNFDLPNTTQAKPEQVACICINWDVRDLGHTAMYKVQIKSPNEPFGMTYGNPLPTDTLERFQSKF